jgi:quercetin dioxygenase-like cupin family protein
MTIEFRKHDPAAYSQPLPGIEQKTLCFGQKMLMTEFLLKKDSILPHHSHPYEQTGYLVKGRILLTISDHEYDVRPGDSWNIPSGAKHGASIIEDSVAIEIFSPVRQDYIPAKI